MVIKPLCALYHPQLRRGKQPIDIGTRGGKRRAERKEINLEKKYINEKKI